jgi:hypothetical protein
MKMQCSLCSSPHSLVKKGVDVAASLSKGKLQKMKSAWLVLLKIMSSIQLLVQQGLAIRGHSAETSDIIQLHIFWADLPVLKCWQNEPNKVNITWHFGRNYLCYVMACSKIS